MARDIPAWIPRRTRPCATLVGGHVGRLGTRVDGNLQRQYIADLDTGVLRPTPIHP
ncbi:hypothetical protein [Kutzneria sp. 744]|uniref:hypothetical protein n=1 Tax=Kutzneria sp. (strain 744) TaxID=345341 RepID=UPI0004B56AAE|nr:hypothetical protein [Kutzneria sp. 744]